MAEKMDMAVIRQNLSRLRQDWRNSSPDSVFRISTVLPNGMTYAEFTLHFLLRTKKKAGEAGASPPSASKDLQPDHGPHAGTLAGTPATGGGRRKPRRPATTDADIFGPSSSLASSPLPYTRRQAGARGCRDGRDGEMRSIAAVSLRMDTLAADFADVVGKVGEGGGGGAGDDGERGGGGKHDGEGNNGQGRSKARAMTRAVALAEELGNQEPIQQFLVRKRKRRKEG